jgi:hypothetical protein
MIVSQTDNELFTAYLKIKDTIQVVRALTTNNNTCDLYYYKIHISEPELSKQTFISTKNLTKQQVDIQKSELLKLYNWEPYKDKKVLFIQIQPNSFTNEMDILNKRQEIETKLTNILEANKLGEWFAGDLGPGGGNILFFVSDINKSLQVVLNFISKNDLENNVLIGRRIMTDKDNWFYEVIYPRKYSGDFNTM